MDDAVGRVIKMKKYFILFLSFAFVFGISFIFFAGNDAQAASTFYFGGKKQTFSNSTDEVQAGYYDHQFLSTTATGLTPANIANGITIFGKTGAMQSAVFYSAGDTAFLSANTERYCNVPSWITLDRFTFGGAGFPGTARFYWEYKTNVGSQTTSQWRWMKNGTTSMWSVQNANTTYTPVTQDWTVTANDTFELQAWGDGGAGINSYVRNAQVRALDSTVSKVMLGSVTLPPRFRSSATTSVQGTTITVNVPSGTLQGDLMLAYFVTAVQSGANLSLSPPTGWTLIREVYGGGSNSRHSCLYMKVAGSSEPGNYSWTIGQASNMLGAMSSYYNVASIEAENGSGGIYGSSITTPSITTTKTTTLVTFFGTDGYMSGGPFSWSPAPGMTERYDFNMYDYSNSSDDVPDIAAGSYTKTASCNKSAYCYAFIVSLDGVEGQQ